MGSGRLSTSIVSWVCEPADKLGAGARPARVTHCRFEHAGQIFGSLDRGPRAAHPMEWIGGQAKWEHGARTKQKPAMVEPVEIPDAEHELVIERAAAIDVAKAAGKVCVRLPGKSGRRFSRVWDVPAAAAPSPNWPSSWWSWALRRSPWSPPQITGGSGITCSKTPAWMRSWLIPGM